MNPEDMRAEILLSSGFNCLHQPCKRAAKASAKGGAEAGLWPVIKGPSIDGRFTAIR
jgi:hypothetical protein